MRQGRAVRAAGRARALFRLEQRAGLLPYDHGPGCKLDRWQPIERNLKGHVGAAVEMITTWAAYAKVGDTLPFKAVVKAIGSSPIVFRKEVRFHPEFIGAIAELGVVEWGKGVRFNAFALLG